MYWKKSPLYSKGRRKKEGCLSLRLNHTYLFDWRFVNLAGNMADSCLGPPLCKSFRLPFFNFHFHSLSSSRSLPMASSRPSPHPSHCSSSSSTNPNPSQPSLLVFSGLFLSLNQSKKWSFSCAWFFFVSGSARFMLFSQSERNYQNTIEQRHLVTSA